MACGIPGTCDKITGYCNGGCQRGWTGVKCEEGRRCIYNKSLISMYLHIIYKLHIAYYMMIRIFDILFILSVIQYID